MLNSGVAEPGEGKAGTPHLLSSERWLKWAGTSYTNCCVPSYGMRYVAKVLKTALAEKFPDAAENEIYKASVSPPQPPGLSFAPMVPVNP